MNQSRYMSQIKLESDNFLFLESSPILNVIYLIYIIEVVITSFVDTGLIKFT